MFIYLILCRIFLTTLILSASGGIIAGKAIEIKNKLMEEHAEGTKLLSDLELVAFSKFKASMSWVDKFIRVSGWCDKVSSQPVSISSVKVVRPCTQSTCSIGPNDHTRNEAKYTPFKTEPYPSGLHIENEDGSATHCLMCVLEAMKEKDESGRGIYVGFLHSKESKNYSMAIKHDGHLSKDFREKGVTVINGLQFNNLWPALISLNTYVTTKGHPTHLINSTAKGDNRVHDGRLWENIYPGEGKDTNKAFKGENEMHTLTLPLITFLEKKLFPHEYFARNAANTKNFIHIEMGSNADYETVKRMYNQILTVDHINLFFRRNDLDERQTLHIDGHGVGVVAIYVEKCGCDGYSFHYVEKSHHRMRHDDSERKIWVPTSAVKELRVKKGDLILFPPCLIHAGGQASSTESLHTKFIKYIPQNEEKNNYDEWTDISYQFTLAHALFPSPISQGKGVILPFICDEEKHIKAEFKEKRYEDVEIDEQKFKQYVNKPGLKFREILDSSLSDWIKKLDGDRVSGN